jgi:hypothetical protein
MDEILPPPIPTPDAESSRTIGRRGTRSASVEVLVRGELRRAWTREQKRDIVLESLGPDLHRPRASRRIKRP